MKTGVQCLVSACNSWIPASAGMTGNQVLRQDIFDLSGRLSGCLKNFAGRGAHLMRRPVAMLAAAYAAGIFIERFYPVSQQLLCGAGACFLAAAIACVFMRRAAIGAGAIALLAAVLGALAYAPFHALPPSIRQLEGWLHRPVVVEGNLRSC